MALIRTIKFYKNDETSTFKEQDYPASSNIILPDISDFSGWERDGYIFLGWGLSAVDIQPSYQAGDIWQKGASLYAIWRQDLKLITSTSELISIADAIRTKGGTSASLVYPAGFISAIENIQTGTSGWVDISDSFTITGTYDYFEAWYNESLEMVRFSALCECVWNDDSQEGFPTIKRIDINNYQYNPSYDLLGGGYTLGAAAWLYDYYFDDNDTRYYPSVEPYGLTFNYQDNYDVPPSVWIPCDSYGVRMYNDSQIPEEYLPKPHRPSIFICCSYPTWVY